MHPELVKTMERRLELKPVAEDKVYLSESKFRKTWMPMFLSYFAGQEGGLVAAWATNVAGNYYREVHVVANEDKPGNVLFVVPGLFNNRHQIYSDDLIEIIPQVVATAIKHNDVVPGSGDTYLLNSLVDKAAPPQIKSQEEEQWKKIYKYYGIDAPFLHDATKNASLERAKTEELLEGFDDDF